MDRKCEVCKSDTTKGNRWSRAKTLGVGEDGHVCHKCACTIRYKKKHEQINQQRRDKYHEDAEHRKKVQERNNEWKLKNPEYRKQYYWSHREHELAVQKVYRDRMTRDLEYLNKLRAKRKEYFPEYRKRNIEKERLRGRINVSPHRGLISKLSKNSIRTALPVMRLIILFQSTMLTCAV